MAAQIRPWPSTASRKSLRWGPRIRGPKGLIIIAESITHALDSHDTIFGRGSITLYRPRRQRKPECPGRVDLLINGFKLLLMDRAKLCSMIRNDAALTAKKKGPCAEIPAACCGEV